LRGNKSLINDIKNLCTEGVFMEEDENSGFIMGHLNDLCNGYQHGNSILMRLMNKNNFKVFPNWEPKLPKYSQESNLVEYMLKSTEYYAMLKRNEEEKQKIMKQRDSVFANRKIEQFLNYEILDNVSDYCLISFYVSPMPESTVRRRNPKHLHSLKSYLDPYEFFVNGIEKRILLSNSVVDSIRNWISKNKLLLKDSLMKDGVAHLMTLNFNVAIGSTVIQDGRNEFSGNYSILIGRLCVSNR